MSDQVHTQEPWRVVGYPLSNSTSLIDIKAGEATVATLAAYEYRGCSIEETNANAARIVECVNALKGIGLVEEWVNDKSRQYVDLLSYKQRLHTKEGECHLLIAERNELLAALKGIIDDCSVQIAEKNGFGPARMKASEVYDRIMWGKPNEGGAQ